MGKDEGQDNGSQQSDAGGQPWTRSLTCKMGFNQQYLPAQRHGGVGEKKEKKGKKNNTQNTKFCINHGQITWICGLTKASTGGSTLVQSEY